MLSGFDFLGPLKWPSLALVSAVPLVSFLFWGGFDAPRAAMLLGPELVGGHPILLLRDAAAKPVTEETRWCARTCATCGTGIAAIRIGYGDARRATALEPATPEDGMACAHLPPSSARWLWVEVEADGARDVRRWRLGG